MRIGRRQTGTAWTWIAILALIGVVFLGEPLATTLRGATHPLADLLAGGALLFAVYVAVSRAGATRRRVSTAADAVGRGWTAVTAAVTPAAPFVWTRDRIALATLGAYLVVIAAAWLQPIPFGLLGLPLLAPGFLVEATFASKQSGRGLSLLAVLSSGAFFVALAILYTYRRRLAVAVGAGAVVTGLVVDVLNTLDSFRGP